MSDPRRPYCFSILVYGLKDDLKTSVPWLPNFLHFPFFYFPYVINDWSARFVGMQVSITCIILGALFLADVNRGAIKWFSAMVFAGYVLRFGWGGNYSFFGAVGNVGARFCPAEVMAGAPKQFAALCGIMFSMSAMLGYFLGPFWLGPLFSFMLAGAAGMEGFLGFCVGCWFFENLLVPFNIVDNDFINKASSQVPLERKKFQDRFVRKSWESEEKENGTYRPFKKFKGYAPANTSVGRPLLVKYSDKTEHYREDDVNYFTHCKLSYMLPGLGWAAVAATFKQLYLQGLVPDQYPWVLMTIVGIVLFGTWAAFYMTKLVINPMRVIKDFEHKHDRYYAAGITIALILFGYLAQRENDDIARGLFWVGAMGNLFLTLWLLTRTFIHPISGGEITPAMTIPLLGNLLASVTLEQWLDWDSIPDLSYFLWAPSFVLWLLLAPGLLFKIMDSPALNPGLRVTVMTYIAAPALAASAYFTLSRSEDVIFFSLFFFSVLAELFCVMLFLANYFRANFNEGYWFAVFCLSAGFFPLLTFHLLRKTEFTYVWVMAHESVLLGMALILSGHTINNVVHGKWFRKWPGPVGALNWMTRLSHDAFRCGGAKLLELADDAITDYGGPAEDKKVKLDQFIELFDQYTVALDVHADFEDNVMFPAIDMYCPNRAKLAEGQHHQIHDSLAKIIAIVNNIKDPSKTAKTGAESETKAEGKEETEKKEEPKGSTEDLIKELIPLLKEFVAANNEHFVHEEDHIAHVFRKLMPSKEAKSLARKCFRRGSPEQWRKALPFIVTNQEYYSRRVNFLLSLRMAYPERMQLFGAWLYQGIDETLFQRLRVDIPELAPRHTQGHWRMW